MTIMVYHPYYFLNSTDQFILQKLLEYNLNLKAEIIGSMDLTIFEKTIYKQQPEVIIIHCHDEKYNFDSVRTITKRIKGNMPNSLLFIDHDASIESDY